MQLGQKVRRPGDGVGFARACTVLNEVLGAGAVGQHGCLQLAGHVQLVVARKDDGLNQLLLVPLGNQVPAQYLQPAVACPHLLPQVRRAVATSGVGRVTGCAVVALVKGQKHRGWACQLGDHGHLGVADGKVNQRTRREGQQRLCNLAFGFGMAVKPVLVNGIANALGEVGFEFCRGHRQAFKNSTRSMLFSEWSE